MKTGLRYWRQLIIGALLLANLFVWWAVLREDRSGELAVHFLDVGQGDAILIEAPNGNQVLIDGGAGRKILNELGQVLPFYDRSLDLVIATHPDADHIGGLPLVFGRYRVSGLLEPGAVGENAAYPALLESVETEPATRLIADRRLLIELGGGAELEILFPDRPLETAGETNNASIVAKLTYGESDFLFTGDAPQAIEKYLATTLGGALDVEVLKVGHHGSDTSSAELFLAATTPDYAVISAGADNRYGHPSAAVLDRLNNIGATILRTDQQGRITITTDGESIKLK